MDTGATHCNSYVSENFIKKTTLPIRQQNTWLSLANGSKAISLGKAVLPVDIQSSQAAVECFVIPMSDHFDLILGEDWCESTSCEISFKTYSLKCDDADGRRHTLLTQATDGPTLCRIVSAIHLEQSLQQDDMLYVVNVIEGHGHVNAVHSDTMPNDPELQSVLDKYKDRFPTELPAKLPPERNVYHTIPLKNNDPPPPRKSYRLSKPEIAELNTQVAYLLQKGYIQPSSSPYGHPVLFVKKKNGNLRMCIDYRSLNQQTVKNRYPLPRIDDLFDQLQGAKVFSSIDLQSAYYQVRLKPEDVPKTAFTTPLGLYEFRVLCFGLTNAPGTFQNIMNDVLKDVIGKFVIVYLDDIVVFSKNQADHYKHLQFVLQLLREHELYANLAKRKFVQPELHFLGYIVGAQGLRVDPQKVAIVQDWPVPKDKNSLRKFWGLANYFRNFIMGWAVLVSALQALLKKSDSFEWNADCDTAFDGIKHALCNAPVLALPDLNEPFEVICDACGVGLGAVLLQDGRPVAFDGKRLSPAEQNYSAGEQELLAVIHALELWRCYLDGVEFTVVTDHSPNTFFATKALLSPRQTRWAERLSRFQFCWEYRPGRINVADPLSRHPSFSANMVSATIATAELAQLSLSSVTDADIVAENDAAATADIEMLEPDI